MTSNQSGNLESSNLLVFFYRWKWPIIILCVVAAIVSSVVSLLIEEKYRSSVVMFATPQHSFGEQLLEDVKREDVLEYGEKEDAERLLQILNSDQIRGKVIEQFNLWEEYEIDPDEAGANALIALEYKGNVTAKMTRFGSIRVDVLDNDPDRARDMANYISSLSDTLSNKLKIERATQAFVYAEASYENLLAEITTLEDSMSVLRSLGVFDYITQIEGLNDQYATAIAEGQPTRAEQLRTQMQELSKYGSVYTKLETLIESAYEKQEVVKKRYDLMKIDVEAQLPAKFVVDYAASSDKKAYPVRWLIVAMSVASTFVFVVIMLLLWDNFKQLKTEGKI
jgi:tyrosine-protein kinase Etk/Wzc